jgi:methionyl-tRNA formyltransferase
VRCPILPEDNIGTLYDKLMNIGSGLVLETVEKIAAGNIEPIVQSHIPDSELKPAPKIFKEDCLIDWTKEGEQIVNFVRGLSPYPAAWSRMYKEGQEVGSAKIFNVRFEQANHERTAGEVRTDGRTTLEVACKDGWIALEELQLAGKRRMAVRDLLLGLRDAADYCFTSK